MLYSLLDSFEDDIVSNGELYRRISHLQGGMDAFFGERLGCSKKQQRRSVRCCNEERHLNVGHVPRTISCVCKLFLRQRGFISCEVTGSSRPSVDLSPF